MKSLQHYVQDYPKSGLTFLVGSHAQELNTIKSDEDTMTLVLIPFDEIRPIKTYEDSTQVNDNNTKFAKFIHTLITLSKGSPSTMDILWSKPLNMDMDNPLHRFMVVTLGLIKLDGLMNSRQSFAALMGFALQCQKQWNKTGNVKDYVHFYRVTAMAKHLAETGVLKPLHQFASNATMEMLRNAKLTDTIEQDDLLLATHMYDDVNSRYKEIMKKLPDNSDAFKQFINTIVEYGLLDLAIKDRGL